MDEDTGELRELDVDRSRKSPSGGRRRDLGTRRRGSDPYEQPAAWESGLVARLVAGDVAALLSLYDQIGAAVYGIALSVTGDAAVAREITADVYQSVWQHPAELLDTEPVGAVTDSLRGRLSSRAHQRAVAWVRTHPDHASPAHPASPELLAADAQETAPAPNPLESASAKALSAQVGAAYADLSQSERAALQTVYYEGRSVDDAASRLDLTPSVLRRHLLTALRQLTDFLRNAAHTEQAIGIVMERDKVDAGEALAVLVRAARNGDTTIGDMARRLTETGRMSPGEDEPAGAV